MGLFKNESELAALVVGWLHDLHWEVYQEVQLSRYGRIADIVAVQGRLTWIIECKLSLGLSVIEQAVLWTHSSHYTSVAVPATCNSFGEIVCKRFGVGVLRAGVLRVGGGICEAVPPPLNRRALAQNIRNVLVPQQKTWATAGNANGNRWSPFAQTCHDVRLAVTRKPGLTLKELLAEVRTHYLTTATARACLVKWIRAGKVKGVRLEGTRPIRLYVEDS